jgi:Tat protein translocase TatC
MSPGIIKKNHNKDPLANSRMSFGDHLEELRSRMIKSIYGLLVGFGVSFYFRDFILRFLSQPLLMALEASHIDHQLYVSSLPEAFIMSVRLSLYAGIFFASPWIIYQMWGFVAAGLYPHEKRYVNVFMPFSAILFILGGAFFICIVAPISYNFFIKWTTNTEAPTVWKNFMYKMITGDDTEEGEETPVGSGSFSPGFAGGVSDGRYLYLGPLSLEGRPGAVVLRYDSRGDFPDPNFWSTFQLEKLGAVDPNRPDNWGPFQPAHLMAPAPDDEKKPLIKPWFTLREYVSLVILLGLAFGVAFQMPLAVFFLGRLGLVGLVTLKSNRKYVFFGIVVASALMTPPDVISQVLLSLPMYVLYEVGIVMLMVWPRKS